MDTFFALLFGTALTVFFIAWITVFPTIGLLWSIGWLQ